MTAASPGAPRIFGLTISPLTASRIAEAIATNRRTAAEGVGLVVTPNIQHVALLREDARFRAAYDHAAVIVCDGFPVHYYARWRGCPSPERVTGCDIVAALLGRSGWTAQDRLFFLVDHATTAQAVQAWAGRHGLEIATLVPPFGFERDAAQCQTILDAIRSHGTTLLFMGLGAPKSEIFVDRHRDSLPPCWALCIGQAVKMALGLTPTPPAIVKSLNIEWLWRLMLEPKRMAVRYPKSIAGFALAVWSDLSGRWPP